jgi:hypothetical protein
VQTTFDRHARNEAISGDERLDALLGQSSAESIRQWCSAKANRQVIPVTDSCVADLSTDASAADAFAEAFKDEIIFCNGHWYRRHNQVFEPTLDVIVQSLAKQLFQNVVVTNNFGPFPVSSFKSCLNRTRINAAVELSRARFNVAGDAIDSATDFVGCSDGHVLNLGTDGQHSTHAGIITKKLGASQYPGASRPTWMNFLSRIFNNDQGTMDFVRRIHSKVTFA